MGFTKYFDKVPKIQKSQIPAQMVAIKINGTNEIKLLPDALNDLYNSVSSTESGEELDLEELTKIVESNTDRIEVIEDIIDTITFENYWIDVD